MINYAELLHGIDFYVGDADWSRGRDLLEQCAPAIRALMERLEQAKQYMQHKEDCNYMAIGCYNDGTFNAICKCGLSVFLTEGDRS